MTDSIHHHTETDDGCPCGPTLEPVKRDDGSVGWIVVHHSLDGRELTEEGRRLASEREDLVAAGVDPSDLLVPLDHLDAAIVSDHGLRCITNPCQPCQIESVLDAHRAVISGDDDGWHVICSCGHDELGFGVNAHLAAVLDDHLEGRA